MVWYPKFIVKFTNFEKIIELTFLIIHHIITSQYFTLLHSPRLSRWTRWGFSPPSLPPPPSQLWWLSVWSLKFCFYLNSCVACTGQWTCNSQWDQDKELTVWPASLSYTDTQGPAVKAALPIVFVEVHSENYRWLKMVIIQITIMWNMSKLGQ